MEASFWVSGSYSRNLFAVLLMSSTMNSPEKIFEKTWESMSDDILSRQMKLLNAPIMSPIIEQLKNFALIEIEKLLQMNNSSLSRFSTMLLPEDSLVSETNNRMIYEELSYDCAELQEEFESRCLSLYRRAERSPATNNGSCFIPKWWSLFPVWLWRNRKDFHMKKFVRCVKIAETDCF
ncbi:hypothetical protein ACS0TY_033934 [Phlomoides rotata]